MRNNMYAYCHSFSIDFIRVSNRIYYNVNVFIVSSLITMKLFAVPLRLHQLGRIAHEQKAVIVFLINTPVRKPKCGYSSPSPSPHFALQLGEFECLGEACGCSYL
jgi:hypothetical protein